MIISRLRKWRLSVFLVLSMLVFVGCENVGGVDLNKAIISSYDQTSSEGEMTLEWNAVVDPAEMSEEEAKMFALFGNGKLSLTEMKMQDSQTLSAKGSLELGKGSLPFSFFLANNQLVLDIEGAQKPFLLDPYAKLEQDASAIIAPEKLQQLLSTSNEASREVNLALFNYIVPNFPNPEDISVNRVTEEINGQSKLLTRINMEIDQKEMDNLLAAFVNNLAKDKEGLKAMLGALHDALRPMIEALIKDMPKDEPGAEMIEMALNKTLAVELAYEFLSRALDEASVEVSKMEKMNVIDSALGADSKISAAYFLNGRQPVGMDLSLELSPPEDVQSASSFSMKLSSRWWNVNGSVKAEEYSGDVYTFDPEANPRSRLSNISRDSLLYDILKNDLHVTKHSFDMYLGYEASEPDGYSPYIKGSGTTMVPLRYVGEQLYADVLWDGTSQTITVRDDAEGIVIEMQIGNKAAFVNGVEHQLSEAPEVLWSDLSFVPIRFITEQLGGTAHWDEEWGNVTISKEF